MIFSQYLELGRVSLSLDVEFNIRGSLQNNGNVHTTMNRAVYYGKGIAIFGNGNDNIYL